MLRVRQMKTLQKLASVHADVHNHFNSERHLDDRRPYKALRLATLAGRRSRTARTPTSKINLHQSEIGAH